MNKFDRIRFHYYINQDYINDNYPKCLDIGIELLNHITLTPIEKNTFDYIQIINLPLLPQFPIRNYFVDFGDPIKKIAIEVDSKQFHCDEKKDYKRQREIEDDGWIFYRIKGQYTYSAIEEFYKKKAGLDIYEQTTGTISKFASQHYLENSDCLILFLKDKFYQHPQTESVPNMHHISELLDQSKKYYLIREKRRKEWEKKHGIIKNYTP